MDGVRLVEVAARRGAGWAVLWRVPGVAFALPRLGLAAALIVVVALLDAGCGWLAGDSGGPVSAWFSGTLSALETLWRRLLEGRVGFAATLLAEPWTGLPRRVVNGGAGAATAGWGWRLAGLVVVGTVAVGLAGVLGGAVARSAARDLARLGAGTSAGWAESLGAALSRWRALAGAALGPVAVIALAVVVLRGVGWASGVVGLEVVGAVLTPVWVVIALGVVVGGTVYLLAGGMLPAAVVCDDADGFDAVQRGLTYAVQRPLTMLAAWGASVGLGAVALVVLQVVLLAAQRMVEDVAGLPLDGVARNAGWSAGAAAWVARLWGAGLALVAGSYAVSLYFTGGTALYLFLRKSVDGQDVEDVSAGGAEPSGAAAAAFRPVPGATVVEQAVRVAGGLAESGRTRLVRVGRDGRVTALAVRETDGPRVLAGLGVGEEVRDDTGLVVRRTEAGLAWWSPGDEAAFVAGLSRDPGPVG